MPFTSLLSLYIAVAVSFSIGWEDLRRREVEHDLLYLGLIVSAFLSFNGFLVRAITSLLLTGTIVILAARKGKKLAKRESSKEKTPSEWTDSVLSVIGGADIKMLTVSFLCFDCSFMALSIVLAMLFSLPFRISPSLGMETRENTDTPIGPPLCTSLALSYLVLAILAGEFDVEITLHLLASAAAGVLIGCGMLKRCAGRKEAADR